MGSLIRTMLQSVKQIYISKMTFSSFLTQIFFFYTKFSNFQYITFCFQFDTNLAPIPWSIMLSKKIFSIVILFSLLFLTQGKKVGFSRFLKFSLTYRSHALFVAESYLPFTTLREAARKTPNYPIETLHSQSRVTFNDFLGHKIYIIHQFLQEFFCPKLGK